MFKVEEIMRRKEVGQRAEKKLKVAPKLASRQPLPNPQLPVTLESTTPPVTASDCNFTETNKDGNSLP